MRKVYIGAAITALQPLVLSAMLLPATMYALRELETTGFGQWTTATSLIAFAMFATNLGLRATFVRAVARDPKLAGPVLADQLGLRLLLSIGGSAIALLLCVVMGYSSIVLACTVISAVGLVLTTISTTAGDLLQGAQRLGVVAVANTIAGVCLTAASVIVIALGQGPIGLSLSYLVGPVISTLVMFAVIRRDHFPVRFVFHLERFRKLLWEARYMGAAQLVHSASSNAEALILPRLAGETIFGYFSGGTLLSTRLAAVPDGLGSALYPAVVEADRTGPHAVMRLVGRFLVLGFLACLAIAAVVHLLAGPMSLILFKENPIVGRQVMQITIWAIPVMSLLWVLGATLNGLGGDAAQARAAVISAVINLALSAFLVWKYGLLGACWSMVLRYFVWLAVFIPCAAPTFLPVLRAARQPARPAGVRP
jgi:O-antigen/teichoic acid export membrane protein